MQNNVYGAELDLKIDKFKSKMKEAQNISKETGKKIAENTKYGVWKDGIYTLSNGMQFVRKEEKQLNNEIEETGEVTQNTGNEISKAFSKGLKSVKRLTLGFLGARSAFGLFKKYMSEYSSENEVFAQKMQLTTSVIANALAPAFEFFGNVIQYVVIGLARVVELLFGVNILGKTMDNSLKRASKSAKELNDNLSGLDEISNIDQSASGLSTGIGGQLDALNDFQKKVEKVKELFDKWGIPEKIQKIKKFISDLWNSTPMKLIRNAIGDIVNWSIEHPNAVATILGGMALVKLISKIMGTTGGTGLLGLVSNLGVLSVMAPIAISIALVYEGKKYVEDIQKEIEEDIDKIKGKIKERKIKVNDIIETDDSKEAQKMAQNTINNIDDVIKKLDNQYAKANSKAYMYAVKLWEGQEGVDKVKNYLKETRSGVKNLYDELKKLHDAELLSPKQEQAYKNLILQQLDYKDALGLSKKEMTELINEYMKLDNSAQSVNNMIGYMKNLGYTQEEITRTLKPYFDELKYGTDNAVSQAKNTKSEISNIFSVPITMKFSADTSAVLGSVSNAVSKIKTAFNKIGFNVPSYDVGTDYVPNDQLAMVHEGERIIPKKYNNSQYMGNDETNSLLIELNKNVLELANKPSILNVNGKELAKATYSDYQEEGSRRGSNMSIRRV